MAQTPVKNLDSAKALLNKRAVDFTVAICTYNGAQRLPQVLDRLRSQIGTESFKWEIIIVDNNSSDETATVIQRYQTAQPPHCPIHYCFEAQQGAGFARQTVIQIAQSELIGFLDDDNLPEPNWVAEAYAFGQANPLVGAYGSHIDGLYEVAPPENFDRIQPFLAITNLGSQPFCYQRKTRLLPPSAGLVVRKQAWLASVPQHCVLTGRTRNSMLTGEDLEVLSYIQGKNWEIWHNPAMKIGHQIPSWRLQREYLIPFMQGTGLSRHVTRMLSLAPWQRPFMVSLFWLNDLRKILLHLIKHGKNVRTDLIAACEMQLFVSSLISPFYIWRKLYWTSQPKSDTQVQY